MWRCGRATGRVKTFYGGDGGHLWWLVAHEQAVVITTAPSERQVRQLLWREIRGLHSARSRFIGGKLTATRLGVFRTSGSLSDSRPIPQSGFQGIPQTRNILAIVDEAFRRPRVSSSTPSRGVSRRKNAKMLMIGKPDESGRDVLRRVPQESRQLEDDPHLGVRHPSVP